MMVLSNLRFRNFVAFFAIFSCTLTIFTSCDKDKDTIEMSRDALTFSASETLPQVVEISTNASTWQATAQQSWIRAVSDGVSILTVTVDPYLDTSGPRDGTITVTAGSAPTRTITVTQKAKNTLSLSTTSLTFNYNDTNEKNVSITTSSTEGWNFENAPSWLECRKNGNELVVKPTGNATQARNVDIKITAGSADPVTLRVTQNTPPSLSVSPTSLSFVSNGSTLPVAVTSNTNWTVSSSASWLTVSPASGSNNGSVSVNATANTSSSSRTATLTFKATGVTDKTVSVTQAGRSSTQQPQIRFRKASNNTNISIMGLASTTGDLLAYYQFGTSTGTSSYFSVPTGNHFVFVMIEGELYPVTIEGSATYYYQSNNRYTFEYDGTRFWFYEEGSFSAPQQVTKTAVKLGRMENKIEIPKPLE